MKFELVNNKKKILFIVEAMGGGVFTYIVDLANELIKKYDIYIAYSVRRQTPENYQDYFDNRIHLIKVKNFTRSINLGKDIKAFLELRKIKDKVQPDIIHFHSSKAGAIGRIAFNGKDIPLFYTPHGYSFLMRNSHPVKRCFYKMIEKICGKRNCTTISCSKGESIESEKLNSRNECVCNGINIQELEGLISKIEIHPHPFTVFTLGRICYQKGPKLFNDIAKRMSDIRFVWIGDGELRNELSASNIDVTGWVERKDALRYALNADVFILTSLWEGLPISLLESMYMKKPCVVSDVIGNHDVIHNGKNGYICNSVDDFVKAINAAKNNKFITDNAYQNILETNNTVTMAEKYSNIYMSAFRK